MIKYKEITAKAVGYVKAKMSLIIIVALLSVLGSIVYKDKKESFVEVMPDVIEDVKSIVVEANNTKEVEAPILKQVTPEAKKELCESTKNYVVEANSLLQTGNFLVLDMSTFELFKKVRIDKNRVGYYYRRSGAVKEWYTVFKNEALEDTKGEFVTLQK